MCVLVVCQDNPSNEGAVTWRTGKYHALRLHEISTGQVLAATQKQGIVVTYEIWRGQVMVSLGGEESNH